MKTTENKKLVLRVLSVLGEDSDNNLEIGKTPPLSSSFSNTPRKGRLEGFRKILKLLVAEDKELTREILSTLKHFLDVQMQFSLSQDQPKSSGTSPLSSLLS